MSISFSIKTILRHCPFQFHKPNPTLATTLSRSHSHDAMSWACDRCTFLNPPSQKSSCQVCLSPSPPPKWSCKSCTFLNPYNKSTCQLCHARAPSSSLSTFHDLTDTDSSVGSVFLPLLRPCKRPRGCDSDRLDPLSDISGGFQRVAKASDESSSVDAGSVINSNTMKILSYNVWFREDLELQKRMKALGDLIELHSPEIICFQEVTPNIYCIFQQASWWKVYNCSVSKQMAFSNPYFCMQLCKLPVKLFSCRPFRNSVMGRELCVAEIEVQKDKPLTIATSHLESPSPAPPTWDQMFSKERVDQAKEALDFLEKKQNVIFAGDMNWDDKTDGQFPLPDGWVDAWERLRPGDIGWTYNTKSNQMLSGNRTLQKRLDRFVCKLDDFKLSCIEMIGMDAIPGLSYTKEKKVKKEIKKLELPVLPSDHYGLLLTICNQ